MCISIESNESKFRVVGVARHCIPCGDLGTEPEEGDDRGPRGGDYEIARYRCPNVRQYTREEVPNVTESGRVVPCELYEARVGVEG